MNKGAMVTAGLFLFFFAVAQQVTPNMQ